MSRAPASKPPGKPGGGRAPRPRRVQPRRPSRRLVDVAADILAMPWASWGLLVVVVLVLAAGSLVAWTREQPLDAAGRVATDTRRVRVEFTVVDAARTAEARESARLDVPRVFTLVDSALNELIADVAQLPAQLRPAASLDEVDRALRERYRLNAERFIAVRAAALAPGGLDAWAERTERLRDALTRTPLLDRVAWERATTEGRSRQLDLVLGDRREKIARDQAVNIEDTEAMRARLERLAVTAGFPPAEAAAVGQGLASARRVTFLPDEAATRLLEQERADAVQPVVQRRANGQEIFSRGDVITPAQRALLLEEEEQWRASLIASGAGWRLWVRRAAAFAAVLGLSTILAGYLYTFAPRIARSPARCAWVAGLVTATLAIAVATAVWDPRFLALAATAPVVQVAVLMVIAYDRRTAMAIGAVCAVLVCVALRLPASWYAVMLLGVGTAVWRLRELRDRRTLVMTAGLTGLALALALATISLVDLPVNPASIRQTLFDAAWAGFGALLVGGATLFTLPLIERAFSITTGMTLIELRDPKHPLLRELQQRAPGTYNHSLNVASIAEAAADAIGADALLTYVGCLYHDVGKSTKPEYFVENQSGGTNRHDKLSPAMSLLVIVGHVKDGLELAREYNLPRPLHHFIEAHHGTTLVEFFYHRAKKQAEEDARNDHAADASTENRSGEGRSTDNRPSDSRNADSRPQDAKPQDKDRDRGPDEIDYRYPGPKPRTKEVAISMLADAVESATRSMAEPTASRIEALVDQLAHRRLMDGQFDECDLTFRELQTLTQSIAKTVTAIYHGRIAYPAGDAKPDARSRSAEKPAEKTA